MKKRKYITICLLILLQSVCLSQKKQLRYIAGYPNYNLTPNQTNDDWNVVYTSAILTQQGDSLVEVKMLCDSMHMLYFLRHYPAQKIASLLLSGKTQKYYDFPNHYYKILTINTYTEDSISVSVPNKIDTLNNVYKFYTHSFSALLIKNKLKYLVEYNDFKVDDFKTDRPLNTLYYILDPATGRMKNVTSAYYQYVIPNGSNSGSYLSYNGDYLPLQSDTVLNLLRIPSELDVDSVYKTPLPPGMKLSNYWASVIVDDSTARVLYFHEYSSSEILLHVYRKKDGAWQKLKLPSSGQNQILMKNFNGWLTGSIKVKGERGALKLKKDQPGQEFWSRARTKYSPSIYEILEAHEPLWYSEGILYIYNVDTKTYIQWDTKQADSEILLVENGKVYYRKYDEIYEVPIVKGKSLGKHRLVVKNKYVPAIHFMFMTKGSK